jgi:hypothetical protein
MGFAEYMEVASSVLSKSGSAKASNWLDICSGHLGWWISKWESNCWNIRLGSAEKSDICPEMC